jgi:uncharacterized protein (TIGR00297 family)
MDLQIVIGAGLALLVSAVSYRLRALSGTGAAAAWVVGAVTFGVGGWQATILLLAFFVSSSALSRVGRAAKRTLSEKFSKDARRDGAQVLANGGLAAVMAAVFGLGGGPLWLLGMAGALAAANADTWATELGVLSATRPRRIVGWDAVDAGTSGAVSSGGLSASLAGAASIGLLIWAGSGTALWSVWATVGGFAGSLFDSVLGATIQAIYWCPTCRKETERSPVHVCGSTTERLRGWRWLDNDGVNALSVAVGAAAAVGLGAAASLLGLG